ncbi:hypothetical protein C7999DRAFT_15639 [Corynascus novoguineensis]|uniref:Uncharacterized protein n=1 Tax=Corynascus novoguineensis TaxID=1126955 RepID=A0AAN7CQX8_9PEZI|nr:hypothetical protein C7999DRAFT_15639 [Corynascus novoguineensis]
MTSPANVPQQPLYSTHAALSAAKQFISPNPEGLKLLFWPLNADTPAALETSGLAVMAAGPKHPDPDVLAPYWDAAAGAWHPVSKRPISEPKVSEIVVQMGDVSQWEREWEERHWECQVEDNRLAEYVAQGRGVCNGCGAARPPAVKRGVSVVVRGTGGVGEGEDEGGGGGFVTVHDYVSTVHPWLLGLRGDILGALGTSTDNDDPLPAETELMVSCRLLDKLRMEQRADWIRNARKQPSPGFSLRELMEQNGEAHLGPFGGFPLIMRQGPRRE